MKKLILFLTILILLPTILSANIEMNTEFNSGETLMAKLSGDFQKTISEENIFFYRGHVRASMEFDITKINNDYYLYAILPIVEEPKNYSISIEKYSGDEKIEKKFLIRETKSDFNVIPGFVKTEKDFSLVLQNLKEEEIKIKINEESTGFFSSLFGSKDNSVILNSKEDKKIYFRLKNFDKSLSEIKLSSNNTEYDIPVFIYSLKQEEEEEEQNQYTIPIDEEEEEQEEKIDIQTKDECNELGGTICPKNTICDGETEKVYKGICCIGECIEESQTPFWKIFGWGIIILVILIISIFFMKYKNVKKPFDLLSFSKK